MIFYEFVLGSLSAEPIRDELTESFRPIFEEALSKSQGRYHGFHTCVCGKCSSTGDVYLPNGQLTNSLAMHYLEYHRDEIPFIELDKVRQVHIIPSASLLAQRQRENRNGYTSSDHVPLGAIPAKVDWGKAKVIIASLSHAEIVDLDARVAASTGHKLVIATPTQRKAALNQSVDLLKALGSQSWEFASDKTQQLTSYAIQCVNDLKPLKRVAYTYLQQSGALAATGLNHPVIESPDLDI